MKKGRVLLSAVLVAMIIFMQPGHVLAGTSRQVFLENLNAIATGQVQFDISKPMAGQLHLHMVPTGSITEVSPGTVLEAVDVDVDMAVDGLNEKMWLRAGIDIPGLEPSHYDVEAFIQGNKVIVPVEIMQQFPLEDIPEGVRYVYFEDESLNMFQFYGLMQDQTQYPYYNPGLVELIFRPIPDRNFSVNNGVATVDVDKLALLSFINAFNDPDYVQAWADEISKWLPEEVYGEDFSSAFQGGAGVEVTLEDLQGLELRSMKTSVGADWMGIDCDMGYSDEEAGINGKFQGLFSSKPDKSISDYKINIDFAEKEPAVASFNVDVAILQQINQTSATSSGTLSFAFQDEQVQMGVTGDFRSSMRVVDRMTVAFPVLTDQNSYKVPAEPEEPDVTILLFQGEEHWLFDPFIEQGRLMVSSFDLGLALGLEMECTSETQVTLTGQDKVMEFTVGNTSAKVNGNVKTMDVAPVYKEYEIYLPLRFVIEELGYQVTYDPEAKLITIQ